MGMKRVGERCIGVKNFSKFLSNDQTLWKRSSSFFFYFWFCCFWIFFLFVGWLFKFSVLLEYQKVGSLPWSRETIFHVFWLTRLKFCNHFLKTGSFTQTYPTTLQLGTQFLFQSMHYGIEDLKARSRWGGMFSWIWRNK